MHLQVSIEILPEGRVINVGSTNFKSLNYETLKKRRSRGEKFRENGKFPTCEKYLSRLEEKNVNRGNSDSIVVKFMAFDDGIVTNDNGLNCFAVWLLVQLFSPLCRFTITFSMFYNSKLQHNKLKHKSF